jgi:hypothetical protein
MTLDAADATHWNAVLALAPIDGSDIDDDSPAHAWQSLARGKAEALEPRMAELFAVASASREPRVVVEVTALRALVLASLAKTGDALTFARRASLMARTEAEPDAELLANIVLARLRRHVGKPHLAVRILDALARLVPHAPRAWLEWERLLAGGTSPIDGLETGADATPQPTTQAAAAAMAPMPTTAPARIGRRLLLAARAGDRAAFERAAAEVLDTTAAWSDVQEEARALIALLDPDRSVPDSLREFRHGADEALRYGLFGARVAPGEQEPGINIFAVARPREKGRRVLIDGLGLFAPGRLIACEEGARRAHGRTDAGLAMLVLAGPEPTPEAEFFRRVYGFAYSPRTHRGVLDVLLHRMRKRIEPSGTIARTEGHLALSLRVAVAVADPRCAPPAAARILSALARQPLATADGVAARLGITLRAAQLALQQLVHDGACIARRTGRHLEFQLCDSTFREPTGTDALRRNDSDPAMAKP